MIDYKKNIAALATALTVGGCATVQSVLGLEKKVAPVPVQTESKYCSNSQYLGLKKRFDKSEEKISPFEKLMLLAEESGGKLSGDYPGENKARYSVQVSKTERECQRDFSWGMACSPRGPEKYKVSIDVKGQIGENLGRVSLQYRLSARDSGEKSEDKTEAADRSDLGKLEIDSFTIRDRKGRTILRLNDATEADADVHGKYVRRVVDQVLASTVGSVQGQYETCVSARDAHKLMIGKDLGFLDDKSKESLAKKDD